MHKRKQLCGEENDFKIEWDQGEKQHFNSGYWSQQPK